MNDANIKDVFKKAVDSILEETKATLYEAADKSTDELLKQVNAYEAISDLVHMIFVRDLAYYTEHKKQTEKVNEPNKEPTITENKDNIIPFAKPKKTFH